LAPTASAFDVWWSSEAPEAVKTNVNQPDSAVRRASPGLNKRIVVKKSERRLYLMRGNEPYRTYKIALGYQPTGHKRRKGDGRTPEGVYYLDWRSAKSGYRKALHISYPNSQDRFRALRTGENPGGMIMIHGQPNQRGERKSGDWTFGCIAVSDMAIDEIWSYTSDGTPVEILP
jgi:murein L,D-transpeptidase YafK